MAFGNSIPFLTSLVCSNVGSMSRQDISAISRSFQMLEVLDLGHPNLFVDGAHPNTAKALINLSLSTPRMREINLSSHSYISDNLFHNLLYNWRHNLEEVFICNCPNITHGIIFNSFSFPDAPPRVKSLVLSDTGLSQPNIPQPYFLNSLTTIKLFSCNISNQFLSSIKVLPLHTLLLNFCLGYTYHGLSDFLSRRRQIRHLDLSGAPWYIHDEQIETLADLVTDIISINLTSCSKLTDYAVYILITTCRSLSELYMGDTKVGEGSETFPEQLLLCPDNNTRLQSLSLSHQNFLNGEVMLIRIASIFRNLHHLDLSRCTGISDQVIGDVLRLCREIRRLDISNTSITSFHIGFVVLKLQQLNILGTAFNDEALMFISDCCPALKVVLLNACNSISDVGVIYLVKSCTKLQKIGLNNCDSLSRFLVDIIITERPTLRGIGTPISFALSDEVKVRYSNLGYRLV